MIVGQDHGDEARERLAAENPAIAEFLLEHVDAELVGDGHVIGGELARGAVEERFGEGETDAHLDAGMFMELFRDAGGHLGAETEVEEIDVVAVRCSQRAPASL
jgi:hypothetical protein